MKVWIDQDLCTGDGLCEEIAPDVSATREVPRPWCPCPPGRKRPPSSRPKSAPESASTSRST